MASLYTAVFVQIKFVWLRAVRVCLGPSFRRSLSIWTTGLVSEIRIWKCLRTPDADTRKHEPVVKKTF